MMMLGEIGPMPAIGEALPPRNVLGNLHADRVLRDQLRPELEAMHRVLQENLRVDDNLTTFIKQWIELLDRTVTNRNISLSATFPALIASLQQNLVDSDLGMPLTLHTSYIYKDRHVYGKIAVLTHITAILAENDRLPPGLRIPDDSIELISPIEEREPDVEGKEPDRADFIDPIYFAPLRNPDGTLMVHPVVQHMLEWLDRRGQLLFPPAVQQHFEQLLENKIRLKGQLRRMGLRENEIQIWFPNIETPVAAVVPEPAQLVPPSPRSLRARAIIDGLLAERQELDGIEAEQREVINRNVIDAFLQNQRKQMAAQEAARREQNQQIIAHAGERINALAAEDVQVAALAENRLDGMNEAIDAGIKAMDIRLVDNRAERERLLGVIREQIGPIHQMGVEAEAVLVQALMQVGNMMLEDVALREEDIVAGEADWRGRLQEGNYELRDNYAALKQQLDEAQNQFALAMRTANEVQLKINEYNKEKVLYTKETNTLIADIDNLNRLAEEIRRKKAQKRKKWIKTFQTIVKVAIAIAATYIAINYGPEALKALNLVFDAGKGSISATIPLW